MGYGLTSPISYNTYLPGPSVGYTTKYAENHLLVSDAYKEQQYWLSVYNYAQQFGLGNQDKQKVIAEITTQLLRTGQKIQNLQNIVMASTEEWMNFENTTNQKALTIFNQNQQQ